jgi:methyl-accepting chemotaxis protein
MLLAFIIVIAVIFTVVFIMMNGVLQEDLEEELILKGVANAANLSDAVSINVDAVDKFALHIQAETDMTLESVSKAIDAEFQKLPNKNAVSAFYIGVGATNELYETLGWIPSADYKVIGRPWYDIAANDSNPHVITYSDANTGIYAVGISRGVTLANGEKAVIALDMEITSELNNLQMTGDDEYLFVVDGENNVIFHPDENIAPGEGRISDLPSASGDYSKLDKLAQGQIVKISDYDGKSTFFTENSVAVGNFRVFTAIKESKVTNHLFSLMFTGLAAAVILIALIVLFFLYEYGKITKPIESIAAAAAKVAIGDTDCSISVNTNDEIGVLADAFNRILRAIKKQTEVISIIADGDYTITLEPRSDKDIMTKALDRMVETNSQLINNIRVSAEQVTLGAGQIAGGAQTAAQGATEQAAAVQQLSAAISEVAAQTNDTARMANQAATLSTTIRDSATKGTAQMEQMMNAVREINEASSNISKVIKVIDDIAFQTNILALNAAVEAARAGSAGKGFAVVAEEVRSLAAKSAEAAKDTGSLIEGSIEKAALGAKIANDTSASLTEIVGGINKSTEIILLIAKSSEGQSEAIKQINLGVDQVAQVVMQTSAASEESAAASQQMSGQSTMLNQMISRFKTEEGELDSHQHLGSRY